MLEPHGLIYYANTPPGEDSDDLEEILTHFQSLFEMFLETFNTDSVTLFSDTDCFLLAFAVREVVTNAMKHGNKWDSSKKVTMKIRAFPDTGKEGGNWMVVSVQDEGLGLSPNDIPATDQSDEMFELSAKEMLDSGRGLPFVSKIFDHVCVDHEHRNKVSMIKKIPAPADLSAKQS